MTSWIVAWLIDLYPPARSISSISTLLKTFLIVRTKVALEIMLLRTNVKRYSNSFI